MSSRLIRKILLIGFFLGLNVILLRQFFLQSVESLPTPFVEQLVRWGVLTSADLQKNTTYQSITFDPEVTLNLETLAMSIKEEQAISQIQPYQQDDELDLLAQELLTIANTYDFELNNKEYAQKSGQVLEETAYPYTMIQNIMVANIYTNEQAIEQLFATNSALLSQEYSEFGMARRIETFESGEEVAHLSLVVARPKIAGTQTSANAENAVIVTNPDDYSVPEISDLEVLNALNNYRGTHKVAPLSEQKDLCEYAQKRVNDLVANGGLDGHAGFRADFEKPYEDQPAQLKNYPGTVIAENLANQYCRNMTTGESFIAQTGTALIEWCFDSSTKGHREAQLNKEYKHACVRHSENLFVVIFGN